MTGEVTLDEATWRARADAHAARVFQLLSGENAEDEALSASVSAMGTDWFDFAFPAGGAFELTSFVAPSGNVVC